MMRPSSFTTLAVALFVSACSGSVFDSRQEDSTRLGDSGDDSGDQNNASGGRAAGGRSGATGGRPAGSGGAAASSGGRTGSGGTLGSGGDDGDGGGMIIDDGGVIVPSDGGMAGSGSVDASHPPSCQAPSDCPATQSTCLDRACSNGTCGSVVRQSPRAQVPGDCQKLTCSSEGNVVAVDDPADANDDNACTIDSCTMNGVSHVPNIGAACNNGLGSCSAQGTCVECTLDTQCGASSQCSARVCDQGRCITRNAAAGTFCNQEPVDWDQCDGAGNCVDCVNSGACGECCVCSAEHVCIPA